jgi:hypothetical protein
MQYVPADSQELLPRHPNSNGRDWRITVMGLAVVLLVVSGALVYVFGNSTSKTPRTRLKIALTATNSAVTANLTIDVKASADGATFEFSGTGAVDFATKAVSLQMSAFGRTFAFVERNAFVYVKPGEPISAQFPGKTWVRMPLSSFNREHDSQLPFTDDPEELLSTLLKLGATITPIGSASIDGTQDQGYLIHLTVADLKAHASDLPSSVRSLFATPDTPKSAQVSTTMYVDPAGQLQSVRVVVSAPETGHPATASVDLTLSHFGAASVRAAPPATQTVTYEEIKATLGPGALRIALRGGEQTA